MSNPDNEPVAAVCGTEVRIYGPKEEKKGKAPYRPFLRAYQFNNYGQARVFAQSHDDFNLRRKS